MPAPTPLPSSALCDGGQLAARFLRDAGVQYIFSLSGGGPLNPLYSGCLDAGIEVVHTRHDTAAAFMAEGYARASRGPGVCAVTLGTAVAMTAPAVFNAQLAAVPLVVLAGAAALPTWDRRPFAHGDQLAMLKPIAKWARTVYSTVRIPEYLATALREATRGRPGPVVLEIPSDVMYGKVDVGQVRLPHGYLSHARPQGDPALVREAVALLGRAQRPLLIAGSGVWWSDGAAALRVLVERLGLPVLSERLGRGSLPAGHPLNFGLSAVALNDVALTALKHCDLLVMLGARFDYLLDYGDPPVLNPTARVIQVDVESEEIGYNHAVDLGVVGDARAVCQQIAAEVEGGGALPDWTAWVERLARRRREVEESLRPLTTSDDVPVHPVRLVEEIRRVMDEETIVVTSGGDIEQWGRWLLEPRFPGGAMRAGQTGSLGVDVPYCVAARLARPEKRVILLTGDGGFAYHLTEFDTAARHRLPFVAVVADDALWAQIKHQMDLSHGPDRDLAVKMEHRRWDLVVEALGGHGEYVTRPAEIAPALRRALASGRPACVNVVTRSVVSPETLWGASPSYKSLRISQA